ncbi:MAG: carboxypeptidase-like regulatory domain-containing protein [Gemmatimonadota bacterium]|nr:carboxypeptidase-like regulatory domain-containing protein [Gemmatimonadota bacterium]
MRVFWLRSILFAAPAYMGVSSIVHGQAQSTPSFALIGTVIDTLGVPVPFAQVVMFDGQQAAVVDDDGRFRLDRLPVARTRFAVRRIGYEPVYFQLEVPVAATVEVEVRMRQNVPTLTTVEVTDDFRTPLQKEGFYERMAAGHGLFVTPEMVAAIRPVRASDALQSIPNVVVHRRGSRTRITGASQQCEYALVVDKIRVGQPGSPVRTTTPDDAVSGTDIYAIEVYPRNRGLPAQFLGMTQEDGCGTIVIWTKGMLPR